MSDLPLIRTLTVEGHQYTTEATVYEVATDDDSGAAIFLTQNAEEGNDAEPDIVALTWSEWAEISGHVEIYRGMMPDRSQELPTCCGADAPGGEEVCIVADSLNHRYHITSDGGKWLNAVCEPEF